MTLFAKGLSLKYGNDLIFKNLSFSCEDGDILAIKGDNGCGKTSLCLCLCNLLNSDAENVKYKGQVLIDDKDIKNMSVLERTQNIGIVFQNPDNQLFSPLVIEELAFAPENMGTKREEIISRIDFAMNACDIVGLRNSKTNALSGGEKQLVAIASVLTQKPKILVADEITARIDIDKKDLVRHILSEHAKNGGIVIMVSHSAKDLEIATKTIELVRGKDYGNISQ